MTIGIQAVDNGILSDYTVERKTLLNQSNVEYATWGINHIQGCSHGCRYCYACAFNKRTGRVSSDEDWRKPKLVLEALELLSDELERKAPLIDRVHMSFMTDPFLYDPRRGGVQPDSAIITCFAIEMINDYGIPVTCLTKGVYPQEWMDEMSSENQYGITVVSMDEGFREYWEPGAAPVSERIASLRDLSNSGSRTWVSIEPYPTPNLDESAEDVEKLLNAVAFADKIIFGRMNYVPEVTQYLKTDPSFYERVSSRVTEWCAANGKQLYIKSGTPGHDPGWSDILNR